MINEEQSSEEEEPINNIMALGAIMQSITSADELEDPVMKEALTWTQVQRNRRKKHVELKDLSEDTFLQLIDAKNQDKRFYGWLNFQPIL